MTELKPICPTCGRAVVKIGKKDGKTFECIICGPLTNPHWSS